MNERPISRQSSDIECVLGFRSQKFTGVNMVFTFIVGCLMFAAFYGALYPFHDGTCVWVEMFFHGGEERRSAIPYFTVFLGCWSLAIVLVKYLKLRTQRKALAIDILPKDSMFVLTCATANAILDNINRLVASPKDFILLDRVCRALVNLKNLGNVSAVAECMNTQASNDEDLVSSSYIVLKGFVWAIPVLGFIGTVLGLSEAIGGFVQVVKSDSANADLLIKSLGGVTGGLSIAFETTLIALVIALVIQLLMTFVLHKEEQFLDECSDFCHKNIISKIKSDNLMD